MGTIMKWLVAAVLGIGGIVFFAIIGAFPVMWLWNYVMPAMFGLAKVNFWQALALIVLSGLLFKKP